MSSYIGKVQVDSGDQVLIGSTLYGICSTSASTAAKVVTLASFDTKMNGITIHVKFINGNSATQNVTLAVGSTLATPVSGNCVCGANEIIAFTYEQIEENNIINEYWRANHSVQIESANNIITTISGQEVNVATKTYVDNATAGLSGLTGAMHFRGAVDPLPTATDSTTFAAYDSGDVVLGPNNKEYVYSKGINAASSSWIELGDEGSYALKSNTDTITEVDTFTANTLPTLTVTSVSVPNVTNAGSATTVSVAAGILNITVGSAPTLGTAISVGSASDWDAGSQASLTTNDTTVVVPGT